MKHHQNSLRSQRLRVDYPWPVWAIGWLAILKAFIWMGAEPASLPGNEMSLMGYKYALFTLPLFFCGIGAWNMKRWAAWGLVGLAAADLLFYLIVPSARASLAFNTTSSVAYTFSVTVFIINGPPSAVMILMLFPALMGRLPAASRPATDKSRKQPDR